MCILTPLKLAFADFVNEVGMAKNKFPHLQYLFIILPQPNNPGLYGQVKEAEANYGLLTQCITMGQCGTSSFACNSIPY